MRTWISARVSPDAAYYHRELGEFILPYEAVRQADAPDEPIHAFIDSTCDRASDLAHWNRKALDREASRWQPFSGLCGRDDDRVAVLVRPGVASIREHVGGVRDRDAGTRQGSIAGPVSGTKRQRMPGFAQSARS